MSLEKMLAEIGRIGQIAGRWSDEGQISDIEREIVLDKLKHIYEEVMFFDRIPVGDELAQASRISVEKVDAPSSMTETPSPQMTVSGITAMPEPGLEPESLRKEEMTPEPVSGEMAGTQPVIPEPGNAAGDAVADVPEAPQAEVSQPDTEVAGPATGLESGSYSEEVTTETVQVSVTVEEQSVDQKLFSDEPMIRSRVDKKVILSLYGDDTATRHVSHTTHTQYQTNASQQAEAVSQPRPQVSPVVPVAETAGSDGSVRPAGQAAPVSAAHNSEGLPHKKVLGETLASPAAAVNEVIGKQAAHADVASRLRASRISDLKHSIGINDRFLLIRDLFGGKSEDYERVIGELNRFTALDEAMIYIQENFDWNPDCDGATFLVELLERKLEQ